MKFRELGTIIIIIVASATVIGGLSSYFLKDDNVVEERCEDIIEMATGKKVDLTEKSLETFNRYSEEKNQGHNKK
jgi:hypothetical protein